MYSHRAWICIMHLWCLAKMYNIENKKVVITGSTGFLGKHLVERFIDCDVMEIKRDLSLIDNIQSFNPDYIFHFAAEIYDEKSMFESNVLMTYRLLEETKDLNYTSFVYCGSSSEYGTKNKPMSENDYLEPITLYSATKSAATMLCKGYAERYKKPIVTVRPFSVYGLYEKPHRFIPTLFDRFIKNETIKVSPGVHDFIYIDDFINAVLTISNSESDMISGDVVNIGYGSQWTNKEVYDVMRNIFQYDIDVDFVEDKLRTFDTTESWVADISKLKDKYKYFPKYDIEKGLKELYNLKIGDYSNEK